jgi:MFS family permease
LRRLSRRAFLGALGLGGVVLAMAATHSIAVLAVLILLTRGFGQSALSVVSITMVGQWFVRRLSLAMAAYTVALSVGFMAAFPAVGAAVVEYGWRAAWWGVGLALLCGLAPLAWLLARRTPESVGLAPDDGGESETRAVGGAPVETRNDETNVSRAADDDGAGHTLRQALSTPAFWVFGLASATYGLVASGIALFNESILAERGFDAAVYHRSLVVVALTALAGNFLGGWLSAKWRMNRLLALAMALLAGALLALPHVRTEAHVAAYAVVMGLAGGFVIVIFFAYWSRAYGRAHLGKIQGAAQALTVLASAVGPLLLAECVAHTGSYAAMFYGLAAVVAALGAAALLVRLPRPAGPRART